MKIGEAARVLGIAAHVLRHWEDEGVVVPDRTGEGHRTYTAEHIARCRIVISCQGVGMSLAEIRRVLHRGETGRTGAIDARLAAIRRQRRELERSEKFLIHVRECRHSLMIRCPECSAYASRSQ